MLARESHVLHATPWQNLRSICFQLDINFSVFYMMPTWCDISVCLCMWYLCVCAHWCGCSSLHVWRTDVYVKRFPLLFSFSFFFPPFEVGSPDWTWNSWFLLSWLTKKLQRFIYLYAPSIGIIYKHWYIGFFVYAGYTSLRVHAYIACTLTHMAISPALNVMISYLLRYSFWFRDGFSTILCTCMYDSTVVWT